MAKETTHRDPIRRAERIERRSKKRVETAMRKKLVKTMKTWMRRRGDRVKITSGKYAGHTGTVESNVYERTVDWPDEYNNGHHIMLETGELVTVWWGG